MSERPGHKPSGIRLGSAYQGGLEAALAVVISMGFGIWADSYFGTSPVLLFVGLGLGFGAFILRLVRLLYDTPGQANEPPANEPPANGPQAGGPKADSPDEH